MYQKRNKELGIVALFLADYNKRLYLREISKLAKIPLKTTQNAVLRLEMEKVLKSTIAGKNKYFRLNLDNIKTKLYLLQSEIYKTYIFIEKYPLFKTFLKHIKTNTPLIIFGSFARFGAKEDSDLDLLIISKKKPDLPFHLLPYRTHEIAISEPSFFTSFEKQETLIIEIQENNIILNNHSFYINTMWDY